MKSHSTTDPAALRRAAEARLKARPRVPAAAGEADWRRLQQELEIHQIELELQNEELRAAQAEVAAALDRYTDHFDFAPVGYFNLTAAGTILAMNLKGASLLGLERARLADRRFGLFVAETSRGDFADFLARVFATGTVQICELELERTGQPPWAGLLEATRSPDGKECRAVLIDITGRKRAEEALQMFQFASDNAADEIWWINQNAGFYYVNDEACRSLGYTREELMRLNLFDIDPVFPKERWEETWKNLESGQVKTFRTESHHRRKDGSVFPIEVMAKHMGFGNQKLHLAVTRDMTERKRAEEALRETRALYLSFVEQLSVGVFRKDRAGRFVLVNPEFCRLKGMPAEEFLGKTPREVAEVVAVKPGATEPATKYADTGMEQHEQIMQTGKSIEMIEEHQQADGRKQFLRVVKSPVMDPAGKIIGTQGIQFDITERKLAEEALHREQELFNCLVRTIPDCIYFKDRQSRFVRINDSMARRFGLRDPAEAVGKTDSDIFSTEHARQAQTDEQRAMETGEPIIGLEEKETWPDGRVTWASTTKVPLRDAEGKVTGLVGISRDVTERKQLEAQFRQSQKMETIGTLAGGIAHDLNNVLTPILIAVQLLKDKVTDAGGQRLLDTLEANVLRGAKLIKQVMVFGRGLGGERKPVEVALVVKEITQMVHETFPKSVAFETQAPADLWSVTGDATQFYQVLLNLCVNARDAMADGGRLSIHLSNVTLDEIYAHQHFLAKPGAYVLIQVADTGTGIPVEIQGRIFEPFFTTKPRDKGTGLGLSTCYGIVKSHGGFINLYSELGKGTVFKVYLPAEVAPAVAENTVTEPSRLPRGHNEWVLVVDDEKPIRETVQKILERFGYRVLTAGNGAEAVSIYKQQQQEIAVVVTDMAMPVMDGPAAIVAMRAINPQVKIIGVSGLATEGGKARVLQAGVQHFIPKPYAAEVLLQTLQDELHPKPPK